MIIYLLGHSDVPFGAVHSGEIVVVVGVALETINSNRQWWSGTVENLT